MKEDAPRPAKVPMKRRQLEELVPRWIAEWLASDDLTPAERAVLEDEKHRRKIGMSGSPVLGLLVGPEGMTPAQKIALAEFRAEIDAKSEINSGDLKAVVRTATHVFAAPKHSRAPASGEQGVWAAIRYARHRKVPVKIVLPNGEDK